MWIMSNRLKPKRITGVKIHPNTKPIVLTVYRNNDKRNFKVHNPFKFRDFGITKVDEIGPIIEKKKNSIVKDLMTSLGKRKRKHMELEPEIKVPRLECNRSLPNGVPFVNNMVIKEPEYGGVVEVGEKQKYEEIIIEVVRNGGQVMVMMRLRHQIGGGCNWRETLNKDLFILAMVALELLKWRIFLDIHLRKATLILLSSAADPNWRTPSTTLTFLRSYMYRHTFILLNDEK
ncbi:hypothetical protein Tco_0820789 [Tanacetum coccineum]|uniref:Uncharacterized protein n=1 Tax=Tanacetum coccineum TaxID=301880 RepID=A0ABQ5AAE9_9ASTR